MHIRNVVDRFLDHHRRISADSTVKFYQKPLEDFITYARSRGLTHIGHIKPYHITEWLDGREGSDTYKHNICRAIKACFAWAAGEGYINDSPVKHLRSPSPASRGDEAYLHPGQWEQIESQLRAAKDGGALLDFLQFMQHTGCRPQEARRIEARHIQDRCVVLSKAESKGKKSQRVIHLDNTAAEICRRHAAKYPLGPLFRTLHGTPWTTKLLSNRCVRIAKKVGFRFSPYSMRHTFATEAIIKGVDLQTTATLMGHKGLTMLNRVYAHVQQRQDHLRDSLKRITE